jgi:hypothetical protein
LTVTASPVLEGSRQVAGTVNRQARVSFTGLGVIDFVSDGVSGWQTSGSILASSATISPWENVLAAGANSGANSPIIDTGQYLGFGGGLPGNGDIRAQNLQIECSGALSGRGFLQVYFTGPLISLVGDGTPVSPDIQIFPNYALWLRNQPFLMVDEAGASTPAVSSGTGMFWVQNNAPNTPRFTDDTNTDYDLALGVGGNSLTWDATERHLDYTGSVSTINVTPTAGDLNVVDISTLECGGVLTFQSVTEANIDGFTAKPDGFWFICHMRDATTSDVISLIENNGNTTTSIRTPDNRDLRLYKNDAVMLIYSNSRWRCVAHMPKLWLPSTDENTWSTQQDNYTRSSRGVNHIRVNLDANVTLTGVVPDGITPNGEILAITNIDSAFSLTVLHDDGATSTAANRFFGPNSRSVVIGPRSAAMWRYDDTTARWRILTGPQQLGLLKRDEHMTNANWSSTAPTGATSFRLRTGGAGGGGGGADADTNPEACAGAGGGSGAEVDIFISTIDDTTSITGTTGAGGTQGAATGGNGADGSDSTATYNSVTYTAGGGKGGTGTAAGADTTNRVKVTTGGLGGTTTETQASHNGTSGDHGLMFCQENLVAHSAAIGGRGGPSSRHGGGAGAIAQNAAASANGTGGSQGSGGGGAARTATGASTGAAGGAGGAGWAIIEWYGGIAPI